jgi:hypothetical protein
MALERRVKAEAPRGEENCPAAQFFRSLHVAALTL